MVCTANQCRSPIAAVLAEHHLADAGRGDVVVKSAGLLPGGQPVPESGTRLMLARNIAVDRHLSVQADSELVAEAGLVLGMAREHIRTLIADEPARAARSFTLKDFVRRAAAQPPERSESWEAWLGRLASGRDRRRLLGHAAADDVTDPMGKSDRTWTTVIEELDRSTRALAEILSEWPATP